MAVTPELLGPGGEVRKRMQIGTHGVALGIASAALILGSMAAGCSGPLTPTASSSPDFIASHSVQDATASPFGSSSASTTTEQTPASSVGSAHLIVLGDGVQGGRGLWSFDPSGHWMAIAPTLAATGLARFGDDLAVLGISSVELRSGRSPATTGVPLPLAWTGTASSKIASVSRSPSGTVALVANDGDRQGYLLVAGDGSTKALEPAPNQPFAPLAAWLDDGRLVVLSTDRFQDSRLAVVSLTTKTIEQSSALSGVRFFCVSPDRRYVAAATASAVYAGPVEAFLGTSTPPAVATLDVSTPAVVWALTFDDTGTRLAMLSATLTPDGRPTKVREIGYANVSSSWTKVFDSPTPFGQAYDQVWLP